MSRSYQINVVFRSTPGKYEPGSITLQTQAKGGDLEALLRVLDANANVTSMSVYNTVEVINVAKLGRLSAIDLGFDLIKLK
jgi:hypothetical protein